MEEELQLQFEKFNLRQAQECHEVDMEERKAFRAVNLKSSEQEVIRRNLECLTSIWRTEKNDTDLQKAVTDKMLSLVAKLEA